MSNPINTKSINILLVEDNPGDIRLTQEAFKDGKIKNDISVVMDGEEAIFYLKKTGKYSNSMTPDIILLDLNLPKKDGFEVLSEIKNDDNLKFIPVIILSTSSAQSDIFMTYSRHANCYILKPVDFNQFTQVVQMIEAFWLKLVILPEKNQPKYYPT